MTRPPARPHRCEDGAATAEYAAVTACAVGFASILLRFLTSDTGQEIISSVFDFAVGWIL